MPGSRNYSDSGCRFVPATERLNIRANWVGRLAGGMPFSRRHRPRDRLNPAISHRSVRYRSAERNQGQS